MSLETELSKIPKSLLALAVIVITVLLLFILDPPHSICDVQKQSLKDSFAGILFPKLIKKHKLPASLPIALENCKQGNSPGACYEYFNSIKNLTKALRSTPNECAEDLFKINEVGKAIREAVELMALMAWGSEPPSSFAARTGWLQDFEIASFCQLKDVYIRALGDDAWAEFRQKVYQKYPGKSAGKMSVDTWMAVQTLSDTEIWNLSLFSVRCENYK